AGDRGVFGAVLEIGAEAADPRGDRLAGLRMAADVARQREQALRGVERDVARNHSFQERDTLGLDAFAAFAELEVVAVRAFLQRDRLSADRVVPERGVAAATRLGVAVVDAEGAGVAAVRIVRAADKRAELAELERQPAFAAARA